MNWQTILGIAATISLFIPAAVILYNKLYYHKSLAALLTNFLITGAYNLMSNNLLIVPKSFIKAFGIFSNYLDVPLVLLSLLFFCPIRKKQKPVHVLVLLFVVYELAITALFGFQRKAITYIMGPGIAIILLYSFYLFSRQIKITVQHGKNSGRALMLVSILLSYACYSIIYYFYYVQQVTDATDVYLLYFVATTVSSLLMAAGLHMIRKRLKELQEIKNTRRELTVFFNT